MTAPPRHAVLSLPLVTERLILRRFTGVDLTPFVTYRSDPEVARYQSWNAPYDPADAAALIAAMQVVQPGAPGEWYQVAIADRSTGQLIGDCAFCVLPSSPDHPVHVEIGFTLARSRQGSGYATEAVGRLITALFEELGVARVQALCDIDNTASIRLLERLGMQLAGYFAESFWDGTEWRSEYAYAIERAAWCHED